LAGSTLSRYACAIFVAAIFLALTSVTSAQESAGNEVYRVEVEQTAGRQGLGTFAVSTGPAHPDGAGRAILFGGSAATRFTSGLTVRSYSTGTDYVQAAGTHASGNLTVALDTHGGAEPLGGTGYAARYSVETAAGAPESLDIESTVRVLGTTPADSSVEFTTTITNRNAFAVEIGVRYLLDVAAGDDDGPALAGPGQPLLRAEQDVGASAGRQGLQGSEATAPAFYAQAGGVPQPDRAVFAYWDTASETAFDYTAGDLDVATEGGLNDSALLYYFGASQATALPLAPGESLTVTIALTGTAAPEVCTNGLDDDLDGLIDAADPDCQPSPTPTPAPVTPTSPATAVASATAAPSGSPTPTASAAPGGLPRTGGSGGHATRDSALAVTAAALVVVATAVVLRRTALRR